MDRAHSVSRWFVAVMFLLAPAAFATSRPLPSTHSAEAQAARAMQAAEQEGPPELYAFLRQMPKGADLHMHMTGSLYAETFIADAVSSGLCVCLTTFGLIRPPRKSDSAEGAAPPVCPSGDVPASEALHNPKLYDQMVDAFSMRAFVPRDGDSGHDHFFSTFGKFDVFDYRYAGQWLDQIAREAAAQNTQYLELMATPDFGYGAKLGERLGWDPNLEKFRQNLLAHGLRKGVVQARDALTRAETERKSIEHCGRADAEPACQVKIRFLFQIIRRRPPQAVFAQMLLGFETASVAPDVVGLNIVGAEDGVMALRDYQLQMEMFRRLHRDYPGVPLSLHAGELAPGLVPPEDLRFHIREAIDIAGAERIGHGVDVMYENHPYKLLREMARKHVLVEINLTSNDEILGVRGRDHPLPIYLRYGVPVALSTDDEGVSRITFTHEYLRAVETYHLSYAELKQMARASLEHSFLPGASLWPDAERSTPEQYTRIAAPCLHDRPDAAHPTASCSAFLAGSQKAREQWELERRFYRFEHRDWPPA